MLAKRHQYGARSSRKAFLLERELRFGLVVPVLMCGTPVPGSRLTHWQQRTAPGAPHRGLYPRPHCTLRPLRGSELDHGHRRWETRTV